MIIGDEIKNEIPAAIATPTREIQIPSLGLIIRNETIEPGLAGPIKPAPIIINQKIAQKLPTIGPIITRGFAKTCESE